MNASDRQQAARLAYRAADATPPSPPHRPRHAPGDMGRHKGRQT
jgi:hypothetical protein